MNNKRASNKSINGYPLLFSGLPVMSSEKERELLQFCEDHQSYVLASMPWVASEIAGVCDFPTLFSLIYRQGGRKIYMPKDPRRFTELYDVNITVDDYCKIMKHVDSSGYIELPSAWGVFIAIRRAAMQIAMKENISSIDLTRTFGVSMRNVRMMRSSLSK